MTHYTNSSYHNMNIVLATKGQLVQQYLLTNFTGGREIKPCQRQGGCECV